MIQMELAQNAALNIQPLFAMWVAVMAAILIGVILGVGIDALRPSVKPGEGLGDDGDHLCGFSIIAFMNMMWMLLPFKNGELTWPNHGTGLRNTISLASSFSGVMNDTLAIRIGSLEIPTGVLLFLFLCCFLVWLFMHSKTGMAMSAAGANPMFAKAAGLNVNRLRLKEPSLSTVLAAVGILVYAQGFGFMQLYNGPQMMGFNSVAVF